MDIKWCRTCVETNTRPSSCFSAEGICVACQNVSRQAIASINWQERLSTLSGIVDKAKRSALSGYDCIIGVSGGKDSTRQALFARQIGLKPLLVSCTYPPEQQTARGVHNLANLISLGFDTITVSPAPGTSKELMRYCFRTYGNLFNATELALYACLPITAIAYKIPLILLGENPGLSWGNDAGGSVDYDGGGTRSLNTLKGGDPRKVAPSTVKTEELYWYHYPSLQDIERAGVRFVYLGYFMKDFNDHENSRIAVEHGLKVREGNEADPENTGGIHSFVALDDDFVIVNQMLRYLKFGFGKATQEVGSSIRAGLISREQGLELVRKYDGKCASFYVDKLCRYLQITHDEFWEIVDSFVNKELFERTDGRWRAKFEIK
jgi:N-acetyl sugar amidotransferase